MQNDFKTADVSIAPNSLPGILYLPPQPAALVVFAHGSGSSRFSPRNAHVAENFARRGLASVLFDLLLPQEAEDRRNVFDIPLLAARLREAVAWAVGAKDLGDLPIGLFGASTGAAAALLAASQLPETIFAVVSRGGRPDLAGAALPEVRAPTLLLVGGLDFGVIELNQEALAQMRCEARLAIVPGATHLFEEPGTLEQVVIQAGDWFIQHARPHSP